MKTLVVVMKTLQVMKTLHCSINVAVCSSSAVCSTAAASKRICKDDGCTHFHKSCFNMRAS
jgi:hypothetical protein